MKKKKASKENHFLSYKFLSPSYYGRFKEIINNLDFDKNKVVVDVGCGRGELCTFLADKFKRVIGIDLSKKDITFARSKITSKNVIFHMANAEKIPLKNNSADIVICSEVLQYVEGYVKVIKEIKRILKPKGTILLTVINMDYPFFRHPFLKKNSKKYLKLWGNMNRLFNETMVLNEFKTKYKIIKTTYIGHEIVSFFYPTYLLAWINKYLMPKKLVSGYLSDNSECINKPKDNYNLKGLLIPFFLISKLIYCLDALVMGRYKKSINILFNIEKL